MIKLNCCVQCQDFWDCEIKWWRGEKPEEQICCDKCERYALCQRVISKLKPTKTG